MQSQRRLQTIILFALSFAPCFTGAACADLNDSTNDVGRDDSNVHEATNVDVALFDKEHIYYDAKTPHRESEVDVTLPRGPFTNVTLNMSVTCPEGTQCDRWDRNGSLWVVPDDGKAPLEVARFVTPYGVAASWTFDLTDLQTLLTGQRKLRVNIETWVGPNINTQFGKGWLVTAQLHYTLGQPSRVPVDVVPLQANKIPYGNPGVPTMREIKFTTTSAVTYASLHMLSTGHGQGNKDDCAEWCMKKHSITVDEQTFEKMLWRDDCDKTPIPSQFGSLDEGVLTHKKPRAGWCPGAEVRPWTEVVGTIATGPHTLRYDVEEYENTCRPEAADPVTKLCTGCWKDVTCAYDGGDHNEARWLVNGYVVLYR